MRRFFVLLIENQLDITATIVSTIGQHLDSCTLSIVREIDDAASEACLPQLLLLSFTQISKDPRGMMAPLLESYPGVPLVLYLPPQSTDTDDGDCILEALTAGASDYYDLSPAGLLALGNRLASLQQDWLSQTSPPSFLGDSLAEIFADSTSQLVIQVVGPDRRIRAWNQASETFFRITKENAIYHLIDELSLSSNNLSRLKDIFDQAQTTEEPFSIPIYPLENQEAEIEWTHVQVYPSPKTISPQTGEAVNEICIVITLIPDLRQADRDNLHHNQELQILLEANREISGQLQLQPTLEKVIEQIKSLLYGDNCQIYFLETDNTTLRPALVIGPLAKIIKATPLTLGHGNLGRRAAIGRATALDAHSSQIEIHYPINEHLLTAPLTAVGGIMGLVVVSRRHTTFSEDDLHFFESLVQQASSAISNARLFEETARSLNELANLYEVSTTLSTDWNDQDGLYTLTKKIVYAIDVNRGLIVSWNKDRDQGQIEAQYSKGGRTHDHRRSELEPLIDLTARETLRTMLNQRRPILLQINNPGLDKIERSDMELHHCRSKLLLPLVTKGETIGWVELWETEQARTFTADEIRMGRALASQVAVAMQNMQYLSQTRQALEETTALYRVASALTTLQDSQAIISTVLQEYLQALDLKQGSVVIFDFSLKVGIVKVDIQDSQAVRSSPADDLRNGKSTLGTVEGRQIPLQNNPVYARLMQTHQPVVIDDPKADWLTDPPKHTPLVQIPPAGGWGDEEAYAILVIPIKIWDDIVGAIVAEETRGKQPFNQWATSLGQAMADQLGVGLQNVQLYEAEYQRRQQAETLREVSSIVGSSLNLNEVLEHILDQLRRVIKYDSAAIHLIEGRQRRVIAGRGFPHPEQHIGLTFPIAPDDDEPGSIVINTGNPFLADNVAELHPSFAEAPHSNIQSWMGIPLIARGKTIGLISIDRDKVNAFTDEDVHLAQAFANQVAIALENARLYDFEMREFERELAFAQEVQEMLLPQFVPQIPGLDIAGRIVPARQVGGDFFHFFSTNPDHLGIAVGDVSGKGIPAALFMAAGITAIDTQTDPDITPGELLNRLNNKLYTRLHETKMNIALQVATFAPMAQPETAAHPNRNESRLGVMTVANGGMIAPIGATADGCRWLPVGGLPIGALPASEQCYENEAFILDPLTTVIFTSDGIVEAQNEARELFGFERLEETVLEIVGRHDAAVIAEHIIKAAQEFMGEAEQHDDMTVVVVVV